MVLSIVRLTARHQSDAASTADELQLMKRNRPVNDGWQFPPENAAEVIASWRAVVSRKTASGRKLSFQLLKSQPRVRVTVLTEDGSRFIGLFQSTWGRMPLWARRRILKHWKANWYLPHVYPPTLFSPGITLEGCISQGEESSDSSVLGCVSSDGHIVRFSNDAITIRPDEIVCDIIAHELAHVYQHAIGGRNEADNEANFILVYPDGETLLPGEVEEQADELAEGWGFSSTAIDTWALENGITQSRTVSLDDYLVMTQNNLLTGYRDGRPSQRNAG